MYFVSTNHPERRVQVLLREIELSKLPEDSPNIFKGSDIGCYMERQCATFCEGKYSVLNTFGDAELLAYYTLKNKSDEPCE